MMDKEHLVQLTNNIYKLTLLFPKKEPLRYKMRELADEILAGLISISQDFQENPSGKKQAVAGILPKQLEILDCFFEIAKEQNWVKTTDVFAVQKEYAYLKQETERIQVKKLIAERPVVENPVAEVRPQPFPPLFSQLFSSQAISERQEKILAFLREQGRAQVWQIKQILPEVTKRTLRRDFENLLQKGLIERLGERNNTFYQIKTVLA